MDTAYWNASHALRYQWCVEALSNCYYFWFFGSVVSNVNAPDRLLVLGFIGSRVASELIHRGESTVIVKDEDRSLADDKINDRKPGDLVN